ncbi:MAG: molybdopterin-dependent oxidoreductase, partial [Candidatus Thiodiazotropha endolucinida]|nr:molybdopterin-dependent oxidoreductase [Candidatus Thiodiazotropha taylori]MCW4322495.1 molybdopterin-dependent oxidoreductase [Candidatus Thiodiazotropha taylori]
WKEVSWEMALEMAAASLKEIGDGDQIGTLISPTSTLEELYLAQKLMRGLGCNNIDSRLRQGDFRLDATQNSVHWLGSTLSDMDQMQTVFVVGGNIRKEQPILAHRLRKAALNGAKLHYLNPIQIDLNHSGEQDICTPGEMAGRLAAVAKAAGVKASGGAASLLKAAQVDESAKQAAANLKAADGALVMLGAMAQAHPDYALLHTIAAALAEATGAQLSILPASANSVGAQLAGAVPHLQAGGSAADRAGLDTLQMLKMPRKGYLLLGVEPGRDFWNGSLSMSALQSADLVVAISAFRSPELEECADILLPMAIFTETSGTYVNAEGRWQQSRGVVRPQGESRPGWKILRVLGNLTDQAGFDYTDSQQIHDEIHPLCESATLDNKQAAPQNLEPQLSADGLLRGGDTPLYACDPLVRRAMALQQTQDAGSDTIRLHPDEAARLGLDGSDTALVKQNGNQIDLPLQLDERIPQGCVWISTSLARTSTLGQPFGEVTVEKA